MRVKSGVAASGAGLLLLLAACATEPAPKPTETVQPPAPEVESPPSEVRLGLLLPLTGPAADLAQDMLDAAQMALFDVGANDLVLLPRDTAGTPDGARQAAEQAIEEGAAVILGPLFNQAVTAVSPIAAQAEIRVLAFSNVTSAAADGTFLIGFRPEEQVHRVVRYTLEHVQRQHPTPGEPDRCPARTSQGTTGQGMADQGSPGSKPDRSGRPGRPRRRSVPVRSGSLASPRTTPTARPRWTSSAGWSWRTAASSPRRCSTRPIRPIPRRWSARSRTTMPARRRSSASARA